MKIILSLFIFFPFLVLSQTADSDYILYSIIIDNLIEQKKNQIEKILIVKKHKTGMELEEIKWIKKEIDSTDSCPFPIYNHSFYEKFEKELNLRNSISGLAENYTNHPIIDLKRINTKDNVKIKLIRNYYFSLKKIIKPFNKITSHF